MCKQLAHLSGIISSAHVYGTGQEDPPARHAGNPYTNSISCCATKTQVTKNLLLVCSEPLAAEPVRGQFHLASATGIKRDTAREQDQLCFPTYAPQTPTTIQSCAHIPHDTLHTMPPPFRSSSGAEEFSWKAPARQNNHQNMSIYMSFKADYFHTERIMSIKKHERDRDSIWVRLKISTPHERLIQPWKI